jgi:hypothetical protein
VHRGLPLRSDTELLQGDGPLDVSNRAVGRGSENDPRPFSYTLPTGNTTTRTIYVSSSNPSGLFLRKRKPHSGSSLPYARSASMFRSSLISLFSRVFLLQTEI